MSRGDGDVRLKTIALRSIYVAQEGLTVAVVPCSLLWVGENFISGLYVSKLLGGAFDISIISVRMKLKSFLTIRLFYPSRSAIEF